MMLATNRGCSTIFAAKNAPSKPQKNFGNWFRSKLNSKLRVRSRGKWLTSPGSSALLHTNRIWRIFLSVFRAPFALHSALGAPSKKRPESTTKSIN